MQNANHLNALRKVGQQLALLIVFMACAIGTAKAEGVISKSAEPRILEAFKPFVPGESVVAPWRIKNIAIVHDRVEVELVTDNQATLIQLVPRGQSRIRFAQTQSFDVVMPRREPKSDTDSFKAAGEALVAALKKGDTGGFYVRVGKRSAQTGDASESEEPFEPSTPFIAISWVLLIGILGAYCLAIVGFRRSRAHSIGESGEKPRIELLWLLGVLAVGAALRLTMGPYSLLHENFHAPVLMEQLAGSAAAPRPMAGMAGLNELLDLFAPFSFDRLFALMVFLGVLQPLFVFGIGRSLGLGRKASFLAGIIVAASPLYIRLASSELAFVPATTCFLAAVWLALEAGRRDEMLLLCASALCVSLAGHFRPVLYTCIVPVMLGAWIRIASDRRWKWFKRPGVWLALVLYSLLTADDVGPILDAMGEGTALAAGWWQSAGLRSWPLLDPDVTPAWMIALSGLSLAVLLWRDRSDSRPLVLWSVFLIGWVSFWLTSMNGWPSALRYTLAYGWIAPLWIGLAYERWGEGSGRSSLVWSMLVAAAMLQPLTHQDWIDKHYAPQEELTFQRDVVLPYLAEQEPALVATPWREIEKVGGSFLAGDARAQGHRIVPHSLYKTFTERGPGGQELYWYRGLSCWARSVKGATGSYDERGFSKTCQKIEEALSVVPVSGMVTLLEPVSDADWIDIGTGNERVEIGLFRATKR